MAKGRESGMPDESAWEAFFNPECIVAKLDAAVEGDAIEFGCGYGHFTVSAARLVSGNMYALDIDQQMVAATAKRAADAGLANVIAQERDFMVDGTGLPNGSADYAMRFNILHIEDPLKLLREAYRVLTAGGKLAVIHWKHDAATPRGPSMTIRPRPDQCRGWAEQAGFRFVRDEELCCCSWHWGMVLERPVDCA